MRVCGKESVGACVCVHTHVAMHVEVPDHTVPWREPVAGAGVGQEIFFTPIPHNLELCTPAHAALKTLER